MKKLIFVYICILSLTGLALSLLDVNSEYKAEKVLWCINKDFVKIAKDPKAVPDITFNRIIQDYENYIKKYSYSKALPAAKISLGRVYVAREDFAKAREVFGNVATEYKENSPIAVQALVEIGQTYAAQKDYANLLKIYKRVMNDYPLTNLGLHAPLLIAQLYTTQNDIQLADKSLNEAVAYYKDLIAKHPNSQVEVLSLRLLATTYLAKRQWVDCVKTFMNLLEKFPDAQPPATSESIIKTINTVSIMQLKNYDLPLEFYQRFIKNHPNHPFNETFGKLIEKVTELKNKSLQDNKPPQKSQ